MKPSPRLSLLLLSIFYFLFSTPARAQYWSLQDTFVLTDVNIIDVRTGAILPDQVVIIEKNRIREVGPRKTTRYPSNAASASARGGFLIPGLWDMHVHLVFGEWFPNAQDISLPLFVANGITGVRDMGSELDLVQKWRNAIEAGETHRPAHLHARPHARWS